MKLRLSESRRDRKDWRSHRSLDKTGEGGEEGGERRGEGDIKVLNLSILYEAADIIMMMIIIIIITIIIILSYYRTTALLVVLVEEQKVVGSSVNE